MKLENTNTPYRIVRFPILKYDELNPDLAYPVFFLPGDFGAATDGAYVSYALQNYVIFKNKSIDVAMYAFLFEYEPGSYTYELT